MFMLSWWAEDHGALFHLPVTVCQKNVDFGAFYVRTACAWLGCEAPNPETVYDTEQFAGVTKLEEA